MATSGSTLSLSIMASPPITSGELGARNWSRCWPRCRHWRGYRCWCSIQPCRSPIHALPRVGVVSPIPLLGLIYGRVKDRVVAKLEVAVEARLDEPDKQRVGQPP